jgi:hypothetical protein
MNHASSEGLLMETTNKDFEMSINYNLGIAKIMKRPIPILITNVNVEK